MAAFSSSGFDADDYFKSRPRYTAKIFDIVYAWHERSASGGSKGTADVSWKNAVDVGVGPGQLAYPLQARFQHVTGIDPSAKMLEQARSLDAPTALEIQPPPSNHTISFQEGTAEHTGLADHSTDIVSICHAGGGRECAVTYLTFNLNLNLKPRSLAVLLLIGLTGTARRMGNVCGERWPE